MTPWSAANHIAAGGSPSSLIQLGRLSRYDRHVVNLAQRVHGYNSVNLRTGYPMIEIRTPRTEKKFDAVAMMRAARDKISAEIEGMTLEEELKWLASQPLQDPFLKRLRDRAAQQTDAAARPAVGR
jgi:hypothetical protein